MLLNSKNKTRNRKRPNWRVFLSFAASLPDDPSKRLPSAAEFTGMLREKFPHIQEQEREVRASIILNRERAAKFNGKQIIAKLGLQGTELGDYIKAFKAARSANEREWVAWLDAHSAAEVRAEIV